MLLHSIATTLARRYRSCLRHIHGWDDTHAKLRLMVGKPRKEKIDHATWGLSDAGLFGYRVWHATSRFHRLDSIRSAGYKFEPHSVLPGIQDKWRFVEIGACCTIETRRFLLRGLAEPLPERVDP